MKDARLAHLGPSLEEALQSRAGLRVRRGQDKAQISMPYYMAYSGRFLLEC